MRRGSRWALAALLAGAAALQGCAAAGTAALTIGMEIATRALDLDTAIVENLGARRERSALGDAFRPSALPEGRAQ